MLRRIMKKNITIVTPVFNDWDCLQHLVINIAKALENKVHTIRLVVVNDCSIELPSNTFEVPNNMMFDQLNLITNIGHQRAILTGLCYCYESQFDSDYIIVMDSDGEDNPKYIQELVDKCESSEVKKVVFAKRSKRSEALYFRVFYKIYILIFKFLTGVSISFGNFSCIPKSLLSRICNESDFWNHYSAAMIKSRIPYDTIPTERSQRYTGTSKMNVNNLILHGLSSLSVHVESIIVRILKLNFLVFLLLILCAFVVFYVKYFTALAIPGWATYIFGFIFNILITIGLFNLLIILSHLSNRNRPISSPLSFYKSLVKNK